MPRAMPVAAVSMALLALAGLTPGSAAAQLQPSEFVYVAGGTNHTAELRRMAIPSNVSQRITNRCPFPGAAPPVCFFRDPTAGPDGSRIAFGVESGGQERCWSIWTIDHDGRNALRLTNGCRDFEPSWSPDGRQIVFRRTEPGSAVYLADACGGPPPLRNARRLTEGEKPSFSRDGEWVVYQHDGDIWRIRPNGSQRTNLTNGRGRHRNSDPSWTKPGTPTSSGNPDIYDRIIFVSDRDGPGDIYSMNATGGDLRRLTTTRSSKSSPGFTMLPIAWIYQDGFDLMVKRTSAAPSRVGSGRSPSFGVTPQPGDLCPR